TLLWAALFLLKGGVQAALYFADEVTWLGIARVGMGYPPYLVMLFVTVWAVRRVTHDDAVGGGSTQPGLAAKDAKEAG
ncbi:MAG: DUF3159 domain-containing protein, partial [Micromonosporaceae bacterium]